MRREGHGRIVMKHLARHAGQEARTIYSATKGALQSMARTWALELGPQNITVQLRGARPHRDHTPSGRTIHPSPNVPEAAGDNPLGRMGTPEDVANAVSFFCDARAGFVTGQTLFVCGGVTVG